MRHIPAGMENFPATDDRGWAIIQKTIDVSDYYVVIVGGRYGSTQESSGLSWTQLEYEYAKSKCIPILAFVRERTHITSNKAETTEDAIAKLDGFVRTLRDNHHSKAWTTPEDLTAKVVQALLHQISDDEDSERPRSGWYRGGSSILVSPATVAEITRLSAENAELRAQVAELLTANQPELLLVTSDDGQLPDEVTVTRKATVLTDVGAMIASFSIAGARDPESIKEYARTQVATVWLQLTIRNVGLFVARGVVVDLTYEGIEDLYLNSLPSPAGLLVPSPGPRWYLNPAEHVYVDRHAVRETVGLVRQRVKSVTSQGAERLVRMGLKLPIKNQEVAERTMVVKYQIGHEGGPPVSGQFRVVLRLRGTEQLTSQELLSRD